VARLRTDSLRKLKRFLQTLLATMRSLLLREEGKRVEREEKGREWRERGKVRGKGKGVLEGKGREGL